MRRAFLADILSRYLSCRNRPDHRRPLRRLHRVAAAREPCRTPDHVAGRLCGELAEGRIPWGCGVSRWAFAAVFGAFALWSTGAGAEMQCRASRELLDLNNSLEIARAAVTEERDLRIVAMGSSSTQGY